MAQFSVNTERFDPYKNFKFRVKWDGRYVAGVSKVGALKRTTEVVTHREGGDPSTERKSPGKTKYEAITLERGVTHDPEFEQWANKVWNYGSGLGAAPAGEVGLLELQADAGQGRLRLRGQARSLEAAFDYVGSLPTTGALREARIERHEWVEVGAATVLEFSASAAWGAAR